MMLTADDQRMLVALCEYRYLQTRQFYRLLPGRSEQVLRRRLRLLAAHELVHRIERDIRVGLALDNVYCLTRRGLVVVAEQMGCSLEELASSQKAARVSIPYLSHSILVNDIRMTAEAALAAHPQLVLREWIGEYATEGGFYRLKQTLEGPDGQRYFFAPDGTALIHRRVDDPSKAVLFCIEADRGTEPLTRIRAKAIGYELFARSDGMRRFAATALRVLFVLEDAGRRLEHMRELLANHSTVRFFLAASSDLRPETFFAAPIWTAQDGTKTALYRP